MAEEFAVYCFFPKPRLLSNDRERISFREICRFFIENGTSPGVAIGEEHKLGGTSYRILPTLLPSKVGSLDEAAEKIQEAKGGSLDLVLKSKGWLSLDLQDGFSIYSHSSSVAWISFSLPEGCVKDFLTEDRREEDKAVQAASKMAKLAEDFQVRFHPIWICGGVATSRRLQEIFKDPPEMPELIEKVTRFNFFFWLNIFSSEILIGRHISKLEEKVISIEKAYYQAKYRQKIERFAWLQDGSVTYIGSINPYRVPDRLLD